MKSKAILRSAAVMMSLLTVLPCFGNATFAMNCNEKNERQPLAQRKADSPEKVKKKNLETVKIFNQLGIDLNGKIDDKKVKKFLNRMKNDPLVKPYLNYVGENFIIGEFNEDKMSGILGREIYIDDIGEKFKEKVKVNSLEDNRMSVYMFYLSYLIKRSSITNGVMVGENKIYPVNMSLLVELMFRFCDYRFIEFFKAGQRYIKESGMPNSENFLNNFKRDFFIEKNGKLNKVGYGSFLICEKNYIENKINPELKKETFEKDNIFLKNDDSTSEDGGKANVVIFSFFFQYLKTYVELLERGISINSPEQMRALIKKERQPKTENSKTENSKTEKQKTEKQKAKKRKAKNAKTEQPQVEQPQVEQPQVEQPQVEQPQADQPQIEQPQIEQPQVEQPQVEQPQAENPRKKTGKRRRKPQTKQQQAENPKAKNAKTEKQQADEQNNPKNDGLPTGDVNSFFEEKRIKELKRIGDYTKVFTEGENGATRTVYFPIDVLYCIGGTVKQKARIIESIKKIVYDVSRLPNAEFSQFDTYTGNTLSDFLSDYFTENAKKCFTNSKSQYVYRYRINKKCNIVFIKKGNEIVFLNSSDHIYNGKE
ncbi:MAG: hypothetical protein IJG00_05475 [Clostridia bacterium]|nr:hypothetical protein [Clostridia bacterium]